MVNKKRLGNDEGIRSRRNVANKKQAAGKRHPRDRGNGGNAGSNAASNKNADGGKNTASDKNIAGDEAVVSEENTGHSRHGEFIESDEHAGFTAKTESNERSGSVPGAENEKYNEKNTEKNNEKNIGFEESPENILMRFCRESKRYTPKEIAVQLGVNTEMYRKMEKGDLLITRQQAIQLGRLYEVSSAYFYKEAVQLDLLLTRMAIIRILKNENDLLVRKLKERQERG